MKKRKPQLALISAKPEHEKLTWPGLKAKDHLSRVITREVKQAKEARENEEWAGYQIARVLDCVSPQTAIRLLLHETHRRSNPTVGLRNFARNFLRRGRTRARL